MVRSRNHIAIHSTTGVLLIGLLLPPPAAGADLAGKGNESKADRESVIAEKRRVQGLVAKIRKPGISGEEWTAAAEALVDAGAYGAEQLARSLFGMYRGEKTRYQSQFAAAASRRLRKSVDMRTVGGTVRKLRKRAGDVYGAGEPTKSTITEKLDPIAAELASLLTVDRAAVLEADEKLPPRRERLTAVVAFWNRAHEKLPADSMPPNQRLPSVEEAERELVATEKFSAALATPMPPVAKQVFLYNFRLREKIDPEEYAGIFTLNVRRTLFGLLPLRLDLRINARARGWSTRMKSSGEFKHMSLGDGVSGENIAMGSTRGEDVILKQWWYSPGHHRNMMNGGFRRIGLGRAGKYWTQQFGR